MKCIWLYIKNLFSMVLTGIGVLLVYFFSFALGVYIGSDWLGLTNNQEYTFGWVFTTAMLILICAGVITKYQCNED